MKPKNKEKNKAKYFLLIVILIYIGLFFINYSAFIKSITFFINILEKMIPIIILIFFLMIIMNLFVTTKLITKHFQDKSIKAWIYSIFFGILSTGPLYVWYPLLKSAQNKGVSPGLISCFLYNRSIKIYLIPIMIFYFGVKYILILSIVMIIISVIQGITINKLLMKKWKD